MLLHWSIKYVVLAILTDVIEDMWMDSLLASRGITPHEVIWDDVISGGFVGMLLVALLVASDSRQTRATETPTTNCRDEPPCA
jgi:hypothetical protein